MFKNLNGLLIVSYAHIFIVYIKLIRLKISHDKVSTIIITIMRFLSNLITMQY